MTPRPRRPLTLSTGRAIVYTRVSTDEQARSGLGLDAQADACRRAADRLKLEVAGTFREEGLSGALPIDKRPELLAAIAAMRRGDVLLVAKRDRLGRDTMHVAMIEAAAKRKGARIVSAAGEGTDDDGPTAQLMRGMVDLFAQYERLLIGARTAAALHQKRGRGERFARFAPYGWTLAADSKTLTENPAEVEMLLLMGECRAAGRAWSGVAADLSRLGYRQRNGEPFSLFTARSAYHRFERHRASRAA